jgi:chromosome segregation ATPase
MIKAKIFLALLAGCVFSFPVAAKMYKWVDDKGQTHYGETIPPEYANKDRSELGKDGRILKNTDVLTPEEHRAKEQAEVQKRADEKAELEQKRRDQSLLNTFSSVKEIDLSKSRNLQQVEGRINSISVQIKMTQDNLQGHKTEAAAKTKAGKAIPASLQDDIDETQRLLDKQQKDLEKFKAEKVSVEERYETDKARYKQLTGKQ